MSVETVSSGASEHLRRLTMEMNATPGLYQEANQRQSSHSLVVRSSPALCSRESDPPLNDAPHRNQKCSFKLTKQHGLLLCMFLVLATCAAVIITLSIQIANSDYANNGNVDNGNYVNINVATTAAYQAIIYVQIPLTWNTQAATAVYAYPWTGSGSSATPLLSSWPGGALTLDSAGSSTAGAWYRSAQFFFSTSFTSFSTLFDLGSGQPQTGSAGIVVSPSTAALIASLTTAAAAQQQIVHVYISGCSSSGCTTVSFADPRPSTTTAAATSTPAPTTTTSVPTTSTLPPTSTSAPTTTAAPTTATPTSTATPTTIPLPTTTAPSIALTTTTSAPTAAPTTVAPTTVAPTTSLKRFVIIYMQTLSTWSAAPTAYGFVGSTLVSGWTAWPGNVMTLSSSSTATATAWYATNVLQLPLPESFNVIFSSGGQQTGSAGSVCALFTATTSVGLSASSPAACYVSGCSTTGCTTVSNSDPRIPPTTPPPIPEIFPPAPDISVVGASAVLNWSSSFVSLGASYYSANVGGARFPSPTVSQGWSSQVVYEIFVDRFRDGDPSNNYANVPSTQSQHATLNDQFGIYGFRHGGDIQGIIDRIPYLVNLGITALWLTPVLSMDGEYHGYCTSDPTNVDAGFGTRQLLRQLVQVAHAQGIYVILDIVINHACDSIAGNSYYTSAPSHVACCNDLMTNYTKGVPLGSQSQGSLYLSPTFFPPFRDPNFFNRCGFSNRWELAADGPTAVFGDFVGTMFDFNPTNQTWQAIFTNIYRFWIAYADIDGYRLDAAKHVTHDFLAYFSTSIRSYARSLGKSNFLLVGEVAAANVTWRSTRVGKMTMTNVNSPTTFPASTPNTLVNAITTQLINTYAADTVNPYPGLQSLFDFEASGTAKSWLQQFVGDSYGIQVNLVQLYFQGVDYSAVATQQRDMQESWVVLEIHDWFRFLSGASSTGNGVGSLSSSTFNPAMGWLLTGYGTPIIEYGLEQGFSGLCSSVPVSSSMSSAASTDYRQLCSIYTNDTLKRQDMFSSGPFKLQSIVPAINSLSYVGYTSQSTMFPNSSSSSSSSSSSPYVWSSDPFLSTSHSVYTWTRTLIHVRRSCSTLAHGTTYFRYADPGGILGVFSRVVPGTSEIIVVVNPGPAINLPSFVYVDSTINTAGVGYQNVLSSSGSSQSSVVVAAVASGGMGLYFNGAQFPAYGVSIYVRSSSISWSQFSTFNAGLCINGA